MLEQGLREQLKVYLENLKREIVLEATLDETEKSQEMRELLREITSLSGKVSFSEGGSSKRVPSFVIKNSDGAKICFAAIPLGHEFTSLVLAMLQVGGHPVKLNPETVEVIKSIDKECDFVSYISLSCQNCPDVVQAINAMAVLNHKISSTIVDGALFQNEAEQKGVLAVPFVMLNDKEFSQGRISTEEILHKLGSVDDKKIVEKINQKEMFDVLVVGGGPAGSAAAIYSARKGIRTGMIADRIGGQVLETDAIENFISVSKTEGTKLAADFEAHIKDYEIDVMSSQKVKKIEPIEEGYELNLENGASVKTKSLVAATGAKWRKMGVKGEEEYLRKGVAFCPHCDGPLFAGKEVAVIGGGNSGVEGAIDLAGIAKNVTLIEFADKLNADAVLQKKLSTLENVKILKSAMVTEVLGNGSKVTALEYMNIKTQEKQKLDVDGIFVQIGLVPNSEWLEGLVELNNRGEIVIDEKCKSSRDGIFAAGDVSTVPYKQIVIAIGEGAKAALSAFDFLIRK